MAEESQQQFATDAFAQAEEASKYLDTPIDLGATGAEYQYSDWMNNWYLKDSSGKDYVFVPESFVNKGNVQDIANLQGNVSQHQFYNPAFLKSETFKEASPFTYWDTKGYVWELDDAVDNGVVKGAGDPVIKSYKIDDTNRAIAGIGKPTYAPGEYQGQICYVSQPKQLSSSAAEQNFISTDGTRYIGNLKYEYVHQGAFWNTVRKVLPTINMLAPVLLDVFVAPGTGAAFGIGQSMGTAAVTGDWEKGIINAAKLYAIQEGSSTIGNIAGQQFANFGDIAKSIVQTGTTNAVTASLMGRDPIQGFISGGISGAVGAAARGIEGFGDLPVPVQKMFAAGVGSALQGKKPDQIDQAVMTAAVRSGLEAMGNAMDADKYFQEKMGREPTAEELNNFSWYTNRNALQKSLDTYSKVVAEADASGVPLTQQQIQSCLTSPDPVGQAKNFIQEVQTKEAEAKQAETQPTEAQPSPAPSPVDMSMFPSQEVQISPENMQEFQNLISDENFQSSQWQENDTGGYTMTGDDGSTLTVNPDGSTSYTEATDTPYTGDTSAKTTGGKGTAGTTGTTGTAGQTTGAAAQAAPVAAKPKINPGDVMGLLAMLSGEDYAPQQQPGEQGEGQPTGAQVKVGGSKQAGVNYLQELGESPSYLEGEDGGQPTEGGELQPGQDAGAPTKGETPPPGVLKNIGGGASYGPGYVSSGPVRTGSGGYGSLQGTSQGSTQGGTTINDVIAMLQAKSGKDQTKLQDYTDTGNIIDAMKKAGLEDQSDAETARLLAAQGPVAVGQVPMVQARARQTSAPAATAPLADINTLPSGDKINQPVQPAQPAGLAAIGNVGPSAIQQLQAYIADQRRFGATEEQLGQLKSQLLNMLVSRSKPQGTTAYKDAFGNVRTY